LPIQEETLALLKSVYDHIPMNVVSIDLDLKIKLANYNFIRGITREEAIGMNLFDCIHPDYHDELRNRLERSSTTGKESTYELQIQGRWYGARIVPEYESNKLVGFIILLDDFEEKKQAEIALITSEERYRTLVENASEAITITDVDSVQFVDVNEAALQLFKTTKHDVLNSPFEKFSPKFQPDGSNSLQLAKKMLQRAYSGEKCVFEWIHKNGDGVDFPCEIRLIKFPSSERKLIRGTVIDISDRKRAEIELKQTREQLYQIQKFEAIGRLAGGIAHDFNNMLGIIQSHCDLMSLQLPPSNPVYEDIVNIQIATENAAKLTKQLLQFSKKQILKPEQINLNVTVRAMSSMIQRIIPKNIKLNLYLEDYLKIIFVDPSHIGQVMMNLILNAIDAMPEGGKLIISTHNKNHERSVCLSIQDTGVGMDDYTQRHLFEPYYTTKKEKGTGLGLATAYRIIQDSGGRIDVKSYLNKGSTFSIYLPYIKSENSNI
jgi:PAS domain S-box-containing protein